jgi:hypothetical protein
MKLQAMQVLLTRLEALLDSEQAAQFNMRYFGSTYSVYTKEALAVPVCGTQACLAGEAVLAHGLAKVLPSGGLSFKNGHLAAPNEIEETAIKVLGLTVIQKRKLFFFNYMDGTYGWPEKFEVMYKAAKTPPGRLYVAIRRVEHFIKTRGRE